MHSLRSALGIFKDDNLTNLLQTFDETSDAVEKNNVASTILQRAMNLAIQSIINLDIGSLLVMKINKLSSPYLKVWSHDSSLCFSTSQNHTIQPGQMMMQFLTFY